MLFCHFLDFSSIISLSLKEKKQENYCLKYPLSTKLTSLSLQFLLRSS